MNNYHKKATTTIRVGVILALALFYTACSGPKRDEKYYKELLSTMKADATCALQGANGSQAEGHAVFVVVGNAANQVVGMAIEMENLTPGKHALHVHQFGDCSSDAKAAGGHWNPTSVPHGKRGDKDRQFHKGDIVNIEAGEDGKAFWFGDVQGWTIGGGEDSNIQGKSLMIHAKNDDFTSQPSGNAGTRVACGRID